MSVVGGLMGSATGGGKQRRHGHNEVGIAFCVVVVVIFDAAVIGDSTQDKGATSHARSSGRSACDRASCPWMRSRSGGLWRPRRRRVGASSGGHRGRIVRDGASSVAAHGLGRSARDDDRGCPGGGGDGGGGTTSRGRCGRDGRVLLTGVLLLVVVGLTAVTAFARVRIPASPLPLGLLAGPARWELREELGRLGRVSGM